MDFKTLNTFKCIVDSRGRVFSGFERNWPNWNEKDTWTDENLPRIAYYENDEKGAKELAMTMEWLGNRYPTEQFRICDVAITSR